MLTFIVPVKSRKLTSSWQLLSKLLERTIRSICNQTSPNFRVVVVCNEKPDVKFVHPHVHYVEVDFPPPILDPLAPEKLAGYDYAASSDIADKNADKARKIRVGIDYLSQFQPSHIMVVDADDCVSCRLAEYVEQHPDCDGWIFKKGYMYREGSKFIYLNLKNFNQISGTSIIIKADLYHLLFTKPNFYNHLTEDNRLKPMPFVGAVYSMENGENILANRKVISQMQKRTFEGGLQPILEKMSKYRVWFLTDEIVKDFGLYDVNV
jgi:hypothetical protein